VPGAVTAALALEAAVAEALGDTSTPSAEVARARLQTMLVRLGEAATAGPLDQREVLAPLVEAVLAARQRARAAGQWAVADALRDALTAAGIELRDTPTGTEWL
jgi:cysteinyl-tRNA synthetase